MWKSLGATLVRLFPDICPRCGLRSPVGFCADCRLDFARISTPCPRCGLKAPCVACPAESRRWQIDATIAPFIYQAPLSRYIQALKYQGQRHLGRALGELLLTEAGAGLAVADAVVAVPLHRRRLRTRTFNQAEEIAVTIAAGLRRPLLGAMVRRAIDTCPQTELDRAGRREFGLDTFTVRGKLHGMRLLAVDDVITTGATMNALAHALKRAGALGVDAVAIARSVGHQRSQEALKM